MKKGLTVAAAVLLMCCLCGCNGGNKQNQQLYFQDFPKYSDYESSKSTALSLYGYAMCADINFVTADNSNFKTGEGFSKAKSVWTGIKDTITAADASLSVSVESSPISAFNRAAAGAEVKLDKTSYEVLSLAKSVYELTNGYYNPAVYYCADLYGFTPNSKHNPKKEGLPAAESVSAFKGLADNFGKLELYEKDGVYYAKKPTETVTVGGVEYSMSIDLGGIGKGWCADKISELMTANGVEYGYFSFGSSSMAIAKYLSKDGVSGDYTVGAKDPRASGSFFAVKLSDMRLSTSADNEQYFMLDGVRYCHIIDPTTGSPVQTGVASATVIGGSAAEDDALTTALIAMGKGKAVEFISQHLMDRKVFMLVNEEGEWKIVTNSAQDIVEYNQNYDIESIQ